ncbi:hypothetical protein TFLX_05937 [Thermoflexales bacterium]|nr:hypothetical protein TFLX_05937 [Thermoflexales bacterium]
MKLRWIGLAWLLIGLLVSTAWVGPPISPQSPTLLLDEAQTVYLGNLARRANGVPPLRWNKQLTDAARWFSWDSVENRPNSFCGHQDTQGHWPDYRARAFGYLGGAGAENAFCGYVTPDQAIDGWLNSPGHRANLLDPNSREIGLGYYWRDADGRGYVTQDFGHDPAYPPVIIENEAISTTTPAVNLYLYDRETEGGFAGLSPTTQLQISNEACFTNASWQAYTAEKPWTLSSGTGWRSVYVKTRDVFSRTSTVSDTIYLGADVPIEQGGDTPLASTRARVTLYGLDGGGLPLMQFSLGWLADDTFSTFGLLWGNGQRVNDATAWGGTAYRLTYSPTMESSAWVWDTTFIKDVPLVAYVRLKVSDNSSTSEVARFSAPGGSTLSLKGIDFATPDQYQAFPLPFTFNSSETFLIFQFWRSGLADVYVDAVSIFTTPQPVTSTTTWQVPGGNYRGQGVWVRYTNGSNQFSSIAEAPVTPAPALSAAPIALTFLAGVSEGDPTPQTIYVSRVGCTPFTWQVSDDATWLQTQADGDMLTAHVDKTGLNIGTYTATLTIQATGVSGVAPVQVPVTLLVVDQVQQVFLPMMLR